MQSGRLIVLSKNIPTVIPTDRTPADTERAVAEWVRELV
jgi:hypothetical protein